MVPFMSITIDAVIYKAKFNRTKAKLEFSHV